MSNIKARNLNSVKLYNSATLPKAEKQRVCVLGLLGLPPPQCPLEAPTCRSQCRAASTMARSSWKASTKGTREVKRENSML